MNNQNWIGTPNSKLKEPNYGIILCTTLNDVLHFALVKRRSSYGLTHILKGNMDPKAFAELSVYEKTELIQICRMDFGWQDKFKELYLSLGTPQLYECNQFLHKYNQCLHKYIQNRYTIMEMLQSSPTLFHYGVWGFPKGKREKDESERDCALRELCEETDILQSDITECHLDLPIEDYNGWLYQYYVYSIQAEHADNRIKNNGEISDIVWCSFQDAMRLIPECMEDKRKLLKIVYDTMKS